MYSDRSYCGELGAADIGKKVHLAGWVDRNRDLGGIVFIELRDVSGIVQVVFDSSGSPENTQKADRSRSEYVITVTGTVRERSPETVNPEMPTGSIEVVADSIEVLNESRVPPFPIDIREKPGEEVRLRYRYMDLRRDDMKEAVVCRHRVMQTTREYLTRNRFLEIETPILNKSTPEGARDFLVPSRIARGEFYALPQSPQLFKQILMVSGFDRYFQIVKCFRDEDLRNDRQPEFTQIDMELSFVDRDMVMSVTEGLLRAIVEEQRGLKITDPFPVMTYDEAMSRYGTDAPDTRFGLELKECSDIFSDSEFRVFREALENGGIVKGFAVPDDGRISRKMIDDYTAHVSVYGAKGFPMFKYREGGLEGGISKFVTEAERDAVVERFGLTGPSILFFSVDRESVVNATLANMRLKVAGDLDMIDRERLDFLWVTDFPLFEYSDEDERFYAVHHPFTSPLPGQAGKLDSITRENVNDFRAQAYDVVLNGVEIGGGSIRISDNSLQSRIFSILGISEEEAREKFSFLLDALQYGAPPHGGIALGLDRILMILLNRDSIRDVIPFPKTQKGQCLMSGAPSPVDDEQLRELAVRLIK